MSYEPRKGSELGGESESEATRAEERLKDKRRNKALVGIMLTDRKNTFEKCRPIYDVSSSFSRFPLEWTHEMRADISAALRWMFIEEERQNAEMKPAELFCPSMRSFDDSGK